MKPLMLAMAGAALFGTLQSASAEPRVIHYMHCGEANAPMFDAIVVNLDHYFTPGRKDGKLVASVYHRVEQATNLISRLDVSERQARRPGAPKEFLGKDFYLEVQTTVKPSRKGFPAKLELRSGKLSTQINMNCQFVR